ncbi:MAG: hypothetical protein DIZ78_07010 [endosymbiont of Escarpia spicata]|uniref:Sensor domain-containing diguanylate cyclase n=1 Tax=endosymbiont of Escarpia spicata TaxID=2200908 RepID=A0A370DP00_9GAMM|nr:MAG: hypothetical protein DIZ78_07010 [endosymbiont of Escarpia spicata]
MRAEAALWESVEQYRTLVETTEDLVWEVDINGVYTYCSPQVREILGFAPEEIVGKTPFDLMPSGEAERVSVIFKDLSEEKRPISSLENINLHKDGHEVVLESSGVPFFDAAGKLAGYRGIDRDITVRKQAEAYQRESEKRFRELIESLLNVAVQGYDRERRVTYWNSASTALYGYEQEEAICSRLEDLIIPDSMRAHVIEATRDWMMGGEPIPAGELELRHKDGSPVAVYSSHVMLKQDSGSPEMFCIDVDVTEQKRARAELEKLATYDQLTHLPNRRLLDSELRRRIEEASRFGQRLALLFIDLDNFKLVNDTMGHKAGDRLLQQVAMRLSSKLRKYDTLARFGGDEFILLMPRADKNAEVVAVAEKLAADFILPFELEGQEMFVTASIGISIFPEDGRDVDGLLKSADAAMYRAKENGRNGYSFFNPGNE